MSPFQPVAQVLCRLQILAKFSREAGVVFDLDDDLPTVLMALSLKPKVVQGHRLRRIQRREEVYAQAVL